MTVMGLVLAGLGACKGGAGSGHGGAGGAGGETGTSTTFTATTSSTTDDAGGDGGPIVCLASYSNFPHNGPCNLINQDCNPGYTCLPTTTSAGVSTACKPAAGLKGVNELCYSAGECDAKLTCIGQSGTHPGNCLAFCCNDSSNEPCNGGICNLKVDFGNGYFAYMCSYGQRCQILTADACPPGFDCHVETAAGAGVAVCIAPSPNPAPELGACNYLNDCGSMQECYANGSSSVCLYYCDLSGPNTMAAPGLGGCPTGETCASSYDGQTINTGVTGVGLCIPTGGIHPLMPDAGVGDGGGVGTTDAGTGDAGKTDGGHPVDAGPDAADDGGTGGPDDAGTGSDAGPDDAGLDDAGADGAG
jgi:hypothetical protein